MWDLREGATLRTVAALAADGTELPPAPRSWAACSDMGHAAARMALQAATACSSAGRRTPLHIAAETGILHDSTGPKLGMSGTLHIHYTYAVPAPVAAVTSVWVRRCTRHTLCRGAQVPACSCAWRAAGALDNARTLLELGALVGARDRGGGTPLFRACFHGHAPVAAALLAVGADVLQVCWAEI